MHSHGVRLTVLAAALQAGLYGGTAEAQAPGNLEEVVVTGSYLLTGEMDMATGLGLTPLETPQSVTVITSQRILDQNLDTISDVVVNAAGVSLQEIDDVRNTFSSRGFEIRNYQVDGVPLPWSLAGDSGETVVDMSLYERVEVVRGATGLMTGAGDPSASINLVRKHARDTELTGYVDGGFGRWNNYETTADVSSGLGFDGALRGRVVAKHSEGESYQDFLEEESDVFYGVLEADLSDSTLLRVGASYQQNDPTGATWGALPTWFTDGTRTDWSRSKSTAADWTRWETRNENYFVNAVQEFSNGWQLRANYNRVENGQKTRLLYLSGDVDKATGEGLSYFPYRASGESVLDSVDVQLRGDFGLFGRQHEFVLGALHSEQSAETEVWTALDFYSVGNFFAWDGSSPEPRWSDTTRMDQDIETEQEGYYGAVRLAASDSLKFILGARLASWERQGVEYGAVLDYGDDDVVIPYAGVLYDLGEQHRLYASYTEIFQPQNERDTSGNTVDPLEGKSYEAGLKSAWLNGALETSFALFQIEQDNLAEPTGIVDPETLEMFYYAAQGTETTGAELEVVGNLSDNWQFSASFTQFSAEDADGEDVNTDAPRKLLKLFTTYQWNRLTVGGGVNWQGEIYAATSNPATQEPGRLTQDDFALVNLMARYAFSDSLSVQVNLDNLLDEKYYSQVGFFNQYRYGTPMDYSLHVSYRF
ncbi:TonB-dependent siderophore receptor [Parahaliea aestuarii]|uniref:TonB-dependent siderophore receptor n=1 Tax=Parahaliea aestuarii TaxID=1852021 RepID=A0A5C8ZSH6_9GAMM|nr:TonB-dependent siderophore receptor [Parahaliea aestuarii]TXS90542.1 TonB-dependent siderophore receptor [Parahaliea aestuarii]